MAHDLTYAEFEDRYEFGPDTLLGEGGYGKVYLAYDKVLDKEVAIKSSPVREGYSLQREVEIAAQLPDHPNIARYEGKPLRFFTDRINQYDFALMQYYPDGNLAQFATTYHPAGAERHALVAGILSGIAFLHSTTGKPAIIHRDLKPSNILVIRRPNGTPVPKIADFGLAKTSDSGKSLSNSGGAFTAQYMSPEQALYGSLDWRTDLWSFGSTLYFLCTGQHAFVTDAPSANKEDSLPAIIAKVSKGECPSLTGIEAPYGAMIAACWVVNREKRAQSATALLEMLASAGRDDIPSGDVIADKNSAGKSSEASPNPDTYDVQATLAEVIRLRDTGQPEAALAKCRAGLQAVPNHPLLQQLQAELAGTPPPPPPAPEPAPKPKPKPEPAPQPKPAPPPAADDTYDVQAAITEIRRLQATGQPKAALAKCREALKVLPQHKGLQELVKALEEEARPRPVPPKPEPKPQPTPTKPARRWPLLVGGGVLALVALLAFWPDATPAPDNPQQGGYAAPSPTVNSGGNSGGTPNATPMPDPDEAAAAQRKREAEAEATRQSEAAARERAAEEAELTAWNTASNTNTLCAYERYLSSYASGKHAATARSRASDLRSRIAELERGADKLARENYTQFANQKRSEANTLRGRC